MRRVAGSSSSTATFTARSTWEMRSAANPSRPQLRTIEYRRVDDPGRITCQPGLDVFDRVREHRAVRLHGYITQMRGNDRILETPERVIRRERLHLEYVQARSCNLPLGEGRDERRLVHDRSARRVDEVRGRLHQTDVAGADEIAAPFAQDVVDGYDVGFAKELLFRGVVDARLPGLLRRQV